jgi:prevent-host-death family protein
METGMHHTQDIYSLTDFKKNAQQYLDRLEQTGRAEVITVNGKAKAVVMTPQAYDRLVDAAMSDVKAKLAVGLDQARDGQLLDGDQALATRRARRSATRENT